MARQYKVYWTEVAENDLKAIIEYINDDSPTAAKENLAKIRNKTASLDSFPQRGRIVPELKAHGIQQYREFIIPPWRIIYRLSEFQVFVLAVIDSRRNVEDVLLERLLQQKL